ncbi:MAG: hypothetical protein ABI543_05330 [Ignavibacteria bacterium]
MLSEPQEVFDIVSANFELKKCEVISLEDLHHILSERIRELLDKNVEKLVYILYRIDVGQKKTDDIFSNPSKDEIAALIADAVIERQLQKVHTRNIFRNKAD